MSRLILNLCIECLHIFSGIILAVAMRYILELSTLQKDMLYVHSTPLWNYFERSKWYRGKEFYYQLKSWGIQ